jgi:EAL domain-containing protein (putative c-di-GMP-specific phosphodiesterase class I)
MLTSEPKTRPRILVVDDDEALLRCHSRILTAGGYQVDTALDGEAALRAARETSFDVILSDIDMPRMNGLAFLSGVRTFDLDVPVLLITGKPDLDSAVRAVEYGALRYLQKPVAIEELCKVVDDAARLHRIAKAKRQALELAGGHERWAGDRAGLTASFDRAVEGFTMAYQPIVSWSGRLTFAYEALLRSSEPSLPNPGAMLDAAERLGRVRDLGRRIRDRAAQAISNLGKDTLLFVNLHAEDLLDEHLLDPSSPLTQVARRVVLEVTERASLQNLAGVPARVAALKRLGFRMAIDDLGAGYSGLTSFTLLNPSVVKLDMALVRDVDKEPRGQTLVRTMIAMCKELGILVVAEGVQTPGERDTLARAGCDLMQGYLFGRPAPAFAAPSF